MSGLLYEESSFWAFALVSVMIGGWFAWMTGRALALTWRGYWQLVPYLMLSTIAVRFLHFTVLGGTIRSMHYYIVDFAIALVIGSLGYRFTLARLMTRQYRWLYERTSPFSWRSRSDAAP